MTEHATSLRKIRQSCDLGALTEKNLDDYFVETEIARDPNFPLRQVVRKKLEDGSDCRVLVYGHGGCGKSTELTKLIYELGDAFFVVSFSVRDEMALTDVESEDIILVMMERLLYAADKSGLKVDEKLLINLQAFFEDVTVEASEKREDTSTLCTEVSAGTSIFSPLIKIMASLKGEVKLQSHSLENRVSKIRKRPVELLANANVLINAVRHALPRGQELLLIVEDLDKVDIPVARKVFIEKSNVLTGVNVNVIYTIPLFTFHSPDAGILRKQFDETFNLPMIKVSEQNGDKAKGFEVVRQIIETRVGKNSLTPDALDLLIRKTGGVLQHAFEVIETAALMADAALPLEKEQIEYGLLRKRKEFRNEITVPYGSGGNVTKTKLFDRLEACVKSSGFEPCEADEIDQILLSCCALVEYNGTGWLGVHPLVQDILRELGRL